MKTVIGIGVICLVLLSGIASAGPSDEEFLIGLIPEENIFRQIKRHRPLEEYLTEKLALKVRFTILSKYGDIIDRFVIRDMDGAFFGIFTAALAREKLGVEPLVRPMNADKSTTARGFIIVRKDSGIKTIAETADKKAVFVDRATATGYIFALALLRENGITNIERHFSEYYFAGSHDAVVHAVLDGKADVGAVKSRILSELSANDPMIRNEIAVIARSGSLPDTTLCIRKDIPFAVKQKLKNTLLGMDKDAKGIEVLKKLGAIRFVEAKNDDFDAVIELSGRAGINIRDYKYR